MKIELNQIFYYDGYINKSSEVNGYVNFHNLTKGRHSVPLPTKKGIRYNAGLKKYNRTPLICFDINTEAEEKRKSPWRDLIQQHNGYVLYNGDNKNSKLKSWEPQGNKKVLEIIPLFFSNSEKERLKAPPIIIIKSKKIDNSRTYRQFVGYGIINKDPIVVHQYEKDNTNKIFSNYRFEVTLLSLHPEEKFDWAWIDDRRDSTKNNDECLQNAPTSWKKWVKKGNTNLNKISLKIFPYSIVSIKEQMSLENKNQKILDELLYTHYPIKRAIEFESMAAFITELFFDKHSNNPNQSFKYETGWVTPGSGDEGVDFVGRLDIGNDTFANSSIIILGQSKRYTNKIKGESLTRIASRMTRGYMGVVVTLDAFATAGQKEIKKDKLPIIMINAKKATELLLNYMNLTGKKLPDIVQERDNWFNENKANHPYELILNNLYQLPYY